MSKATRSQIKILTEDQLKKLSTGRLLNIHRKISKPIGYFAYLADPNQCFPNNIAVDAEKELSTLNKFSIVLHKILNTREHIERKE